MRRPAAGSPTGGTGDIGTTETIDEPGAPLETTTIDQTEQRADNQMMREGILDRGQPAGKRRQADEAAEEAAREPAVEGEAGRQQRPTQVEDEEVPAADEEAQVPTDEEDLAALNLQRRLQEIEAAGREDKAGTAAPAAPGAAEPGTGVPPEIQQKIRDFVRDPLFDPEHLRALVDPDTEAVTMEALVYMAGVQQQRFENLIKQSIDSQVKDAITGLQRTFEETDVVRNALEMLYSNFPALRERVGTSEAMRRLIGDSANDVVDEINQANKTQYKDAEDFILTAYREKRYDLVERFINRAGRHAQKLLGIPIGQSNGRGSSPGSKPAARSAGRVAERPTGRMPGQSGVGQTPQDEAEREKRRTLMDNIGVRPIR